MPTELLIAAPGRVELSEYDDAALEPGELRAGGIASGISHGTELQAYRGSWPFADKRFDLDLRLFVEGADDGYPVRPGYEWVGSVLEVGPAVKGVRPGDLIQAARPHRETQTIAASDPAIFWDVLPGRLDPKRATLVQTVVIALQAVHDAELESGDRVAVFGLGVFGLLAVQLARLEGARTVVGVDPIAARRELAERLGADRTLDPGSDDVGRVLKTSDGRRGVDVAIELSGSYRALHEALRAVRLAGRVVAAGFYCGPAGDDLRLGEEWHHNRLTMISSMSGWGAPSRRPGWDRRRLRAAALDLLTAGTVETDPLITHRIPFSQAAEAYALADEQPEEALRVVLTYG